MENPVKSEIGKQIVIFLFGIAGTFASFYLTEMMTDPAEFKMVKLKWAMRLKKVAGKQITFWEDVSAKAANYYHKESE